MRETALRLRSVCDGAEMIARIGGDKFAVLLGSDLAPEAIAAGIVEALGRPMERDGHSFLIGASVRITRTGTASASELFVQADVAPYTAKAAGRKTFRVFCAPPAELPDAAMTARRTTILPKRHAAASLP